MSAGEREQEAGRHTAIKYVYEVRPRSRALQSRWPLVEDCAQSLFVESKTETVFFCELADSCLSIFLV